MKVIILFSIIILGVSCSKQSDDIYITRASNGVIITNSKGEFIVLQDKLPENRGENGVIGEDHVHRN